MKWVNSITLPQSESIILTLILIPVRKRNQSHPLARDDGAVNNDGHKRRTKTGFITVEKTLKTPLYQRV